MLLLNKTIKVRELTRVSAEKAVFWSISTRGLKQKVLSSAQVKTENLRKLPILSYKNDATCTLKYTNSSLEANEWLHENKSNTFGLDCEWRAFPKPSKVSLLQLCDSSTIFLFHIYHMTTFPTVLKSILEDKNIVKFGCNIQGDGTKLLKDYEIQSRSLVELNNLCVQVRGDMFTPTSSTRHIALSKMVEVLLQHELAKPKKVILSNWNAHYLNESQIEYAATDAYASYHVARQISILQNDKKNVYKLKIYDIGKETKIRTVVRKLNEYCDDFGLIKEQNDKGKGSKVIHHRDNKKDYDNLIQSSDSDLSSNVHHNQIVGSLYFLCVVKRWKKMLC